MAVKRLMALALAGVLLVPPAAFAAPTHAVLSVVVTSVQGRPLTQVDLDLVNLDTGKVIAARTDGVGAFRSTVQPGVYTLDPGRSGYRVARGPRVVSLAAGQAGTAEIALASFQSSEQANENRDQDPAPLLLPAGRSGGFFGSKAGIITLSALGVASIVAIVLLTRNDNDANPPATPSR